MAWCALSDAQRYIGTRKQLIDKAKTAAHKQASRHHHRCNSVSRTCETRHSSCFAPTKHNTGTFFANKAGSNFNDVTTSAQHHFVVSNLTLGIWNSLDRYSGMTAWATREATRKTGENAPDFALAVRFTQTLGRRSGLHLAVLA